MLSSRAEAILQSIVVRYITRGVPVSSQSLVNDHTLKVSSATIRNEMVRLEQQGYIIRPHTSAGSIPSDVGYRHYVESLGSVRLPPAQQMMISHLFHQVESRLDEWLSLTATLLAHLAHNMAVVATPKTARCRFKHMELVSLQDAIALLVLVLEGARVRQQLLTLEEQIAQPELTAIAHRLSSVCAGLISDEIAATGEGASPVEAQLRERIVGLMREEDEEDGPVPYMDGLHFVLGQPEFAAGNRAQSLAELAEHRSMLLRLLPAGRPGEGVCVVIGRENEPEVIHDYSIVGSRYGLPEEAVGTLAIIGPTRMPYAATIAAVDYMSWLLSRLVARLYGKEDARQDADYQQAGAG